MDTIVGIDLGTTNSAVSIIENDKPILIPNALGEVLTPSVVGIDLHNKLIVGRAAREFQVVHPERCASVFKRRMGSDWKATLGDRTFTPEELSGMILKSLKDDAEVYLGHSVNRAVITVPAYFNEHQRKATMHAGQIAGFRVDRIFNEPTAAALAYGKVDSHTERTLLVFDLGGGTFDVSVVEIMEGAIEVKSSAGEGFLGGEDFTRALVAKVLDGQGMHFEKAELKMPLLVSRLMNQCEDAKRLLSKEESATVRMPKPDGTFADDSPTITIARSEFHHWMDHVLARVEPPVRRALGDAGLKRTQIDEVILVGGATRMPSVVQRVTEIFDKPPLNNLNPDEVVALGAGIQAGLIARNASLEDLVVTDVAPFTLGIETCKRFGMNHRDGYYMPIINRNTTIPTSRVERVGTLYANQREILLKVFQGEGRRVEDNILLGELAVKDIPIGPAGQEVDVRFTYDLNGVLEVEATVVATRKKVSRIVTKLAKGLTPEQIQEAVASMQLLKLHPREDGKNQFLLRRAERLYAELPPHERLMLTDILDAFERALEAGDRESIDGMGRALAEFLDQFDPGLNPGDRGTSDDDW